MERENLAITGGRSRVYLNLAPASFCMSSTVVPLTCATPMTEQWTGSEAAMFTYADRKRLYWAYHEHTKRVD